MEETFEQFRARLNGAAISTYILVMLIVPIKIWCRWSVGRMQNLGLDDYLCVFALVCANAFFYVCICGKFHNGSVFMKYKWVSDLIIPKAWVPTWPGTL
jgi:hypothetical protein